MWFTCQPLLFSIPVIMRYPSRQIAAQSPAGQCMAPELSRQLDDVIGQPFFVRQADGNLALRGMVLPDGAAGPTL